MIELKDDSLVFSFPEAHPEAKLRIKFMRTLRIPDDGKGYPLPPGLGRFPLRHVDDHAENVPPLWLEHGGVMLPMCQSEALWLNFESAYLELHGSGFPFAVKVATGKIDALTGKPWRDSLHNEAQDYLIVPEQPWLDGYCVEKGFIRQFVAMPLGAGYSAEEQLTAEAKHGGLQIAVYPMKRRAFERRFPKIDPRERRMQFDYAAAESCPMSPDMGLAPGGRMRQEIYEDPFDFVDWDRGAMSRCFIHIANSLVWRAITGDNPPTTPLTAKEYTEAGLPWFEYYNDDAKALAGAESLSGLKSVTQMGAAKGDAPLPENETVTPANIVQIRARMSKDQVREGDF